MRKKKDGARIYAMPTRSIFSTGVIAADLTPSFPPGVTGTLSHAEASYAIPQQRDRGLIMTKVKKDQAELEAMVLDELHQVPHCEDARSVTVIGLDEERVEATWTVSSFEPGDSSGELSCEEALWAIVMCLQQQFDLAID